MAGTVGSLMFAGVDLLSLATDTPAAAVEIARRLTESIRWMLTRNQPFAPAGAL